MVNANFFKIPYYARICLLSIGILTFITILYISQRIIIPLICATIIAVVLSPIVTFFTKKKINRIVAIALTIAMLILASALVIALLSSQISKFSQSIPKLGIKFNLLFYQSESWVSGNFNISTLKINEWMDETNAAILNGCRSLIGPTLMNIGSLLVVLVLIPVYVFMILFYQPLLIEFTHKLFTTNKHKAVNEVLIATKRIIHSYLVGLLLEAIIIAALNSTSLLILGVDYAILLGVIGAMLNVIPYIGGIIAVTLPMLIALATKSSGYSLLVLASYILIQFIDNHYIIPKIVASKVQLNALVSVIAVLVGGAMWGVSGMFLSIPLTAILKVICDHIDDLKPWGFLLGNIVPRVSQSIPIKKKPH